MAGARIRTGIAAPDNDAMRQDSLADTGLRICIMGVYGKGNLGDEALLASVKEDFRRFAPNTTFTVFCSEPEEVNRVHGDAAYERRPFPHFLNKVKELRRADAFVIGGGTLLYDQFNWRKDILAVAALFFWPILARLWGVPTIAYAQGFGPARHRVPRFAARLMLSIASVVTLRDRESANLLYAVAGDARDVSVTCDPVVSSSHFSPERLPEICVYSIPPEPFAVVAFRIPAGGDRSHLVSWARAVAMFQQRSGMRLMLLPMQRSDKHIEDVAVSRELAEMLGQHGVDPEQIKQRSWESVEEGAHLLQSAAIVVSNRLHALLLAARAGVPAVGIGDAGKIRGCLTEIGLGDGCCFLQQGEVSEEELMLAMYTGLRVDDEERQRLVANTRLWADRQPSNVDIISDFFLGKEPY